jgi:hypothetical protein
MRRRIESGNCIPRMVMEMIIYILISWELLLFFDFVTFLRTLNTKSGYCHWLPYSINLWLFYNQRGCSKKGGGARGAYALGTIPGRARKWKNVNFILLLISKIILCIYIFTYIIYKYYYVISMNLIIIIISRFKK